jgi:hypothetical protein
VAIAYTTGPVLIYVGRTNYPNNGQYHSTAGNRGQRLFLGTCEVTPQQEIQRETDVVFNDLSGKVPLDILFLGEHAFITMDLTRWNEPVYAILAAQPTNLALINVRGFYGVQDMGAMYMHEGWGIELLLVFSRAVPGSIYAANGMPPCYRFPMSVFTGPDRHHQMGSRAKKLHLTFHAIPLWNYTTRGFLLYDHMIPAGLPPFN